MSTIESPQAEVGALSEGGYAVGVDIGGTFTDCVLLAHDGIITAAKAPTTPQDRSVGFFESVERAAQKVGLTISELLGRCERLVHGTTTGTNALVSRDGAKTGLITTAGQRDVMFLMRGGGRTAGLPLDEALHVPSTNKPVPLVPKRMIVEVPERIDVDGDVIVPLDEVAARAAIRHLVDDENVEALAISFMWAFKNDVHERRMRELVEELAPDLFVTCGSELNAQLGEYERTTTAIMNAYIGPLMHRYIEGIETGARDRGFSGRVLFAQCAGGAITGEEARVAPIRTVQSGPVAGIVSSQLLTNQIGVDNALLTDMGGTTYDVSVIREGDALRRKSSLFQRYELALPMLDIESVGAGGGSIAWKDSSGRLNVGPRSAGASPGPACYGNGGLEPTVTDADVVLGILNPATFLNGRMKIDVSLAEKAVADLGREFELPVHEMAAGINRIVDSKMADLIRRMSVLRGLDPRKFALLAFGGGGPVHATAVAREAGIGKVIVPLPYVAAMWSALGAAVSDVTHVYQAPKGMRLPMLADQVNEVFDELESKALQTIRNDGLGDIPVQINRSMRMKYSMQVHDVEVPVPNGAMTDQSVLDIDDEFGKLYATLFGEGSGYREGGVDVTSFHVHVRGVTAKPRLERGGGDVRVDRSSRPVYWTEEKDFLETPVIRFHHGVLDETFEGPLLLELPDTVVVLHHGESAEFDPVGNLVITTGV